MESKNSKAIALVALIVAVVGLGIGFAAFSSTLTISSSATVTPNADTFKVAFDTETGITCYTHGEGAVVTSSGTVAETTVSGIKIGFTEPGQSAICTVSATNSGEYLAYLNSVTVGTLSCAKSTGSQADDTLVAEACKGISVDVAIGNLDLNNVVEFISTSTTSGTNTSISNHTLAKGASEQVGIKIEYAAGSARADGQFDITVPDITLVYSSVD